MTKNWFYGPYQSVYGLWRRMRIVVLIDKFLAPYPQPGTKRRLIILGRSSLASLLELLETIEIESISFKFSVLLAFFFLFNLPSGHVSTQSTSLPSPLNPSFALFFNFSPTHENIQCLSFGSGRDMTCSASPFFLMNLS